MFTASLLQDSHSQCATLVRLSSNTLIEVFSLNVSVNVKIVIL